MDYIVKLYDLPELKLIEGVTIRRALSPEKHIVIEWVRDNFGMAWASETSVAFSKQPTACFIALIDKTIVGFCAYDSTCKGFLGPCGVSKEHRGKCIGTNLLTYGLIGLEEAGYAYAILGSAIQCGFYEKRFNAIPLPDSTPGWYKGMLR